MLPPEIDPFADHHIEKLTEIQDRMKAATTHSQFPITMDELNNWVLQLSSTKNALTRFKICMADEVKQKERYAKYAKENGYPYS